jgi:hypothetical protein
MNATELAELRRLLAEATPGPWEAFDEDGKAGVAAPAVTKQFIEGPSCYADIAALEDWFDSSRSREVTLANAALIVAAVNALPGLLDEVERLQKDNHALEHNYTVVHKEMMAMAEDVEAAEWKLRQQTNGA